MIDFIYGLAIACFALGLLFGFLMGKHHEREKPLKWEAFSDRLYDAKFQYWPDSAERPMELEIISTAHSAEHGDSIELQLKRGDERPLSAGDLRSM